MTQKIIILLFTLLPSISLSQKNDKTTILLSKQINATNKISSELVQIKNEISILHKRRVKNDSLISKSNIESFNNQLDSITKSITQSIKSLNNKKKQTFNWLSFISGAIIEILGAFIGVGAAIWLFFRETKREKANERALEQKELNEKNHYLGSLLYSSINLAKKQNKGIKDFYEKLDLNFLYIPLIPIHPKQNLDRLSIIIDNEAYYHAFLNKYGSEITNVKKYRGIASSVDFLNSQIEQMFDMQEKALNFDHGRKMKYKELFDKTRDQIAELGIKKEESQTKSIIRVLKKTISFSKEKTSVNLSSQINTILTDYYKNLNAPFVLEYHQEKLVEASKNILISHINESDQIIVIMNNLKNLTLNYSEIKAQNKLHSNEFKIFYKLINKAVLHLETTGSELISEFKPSTSPSNQANAKKT
jgi:hypothetical protein